MNQYSSYRALAESLLSRGLLIVIAAFVLVACDNVPTESEPNLSGINSVDRILAYTGPSCGSGFSDPAVQQDACTFKVEFWNKMVESPCANCHDSKSGSRQSPFFLDFSDVNIAYNQALTVVNLPALRPATLDPTAPQIIVNKITSGHNCGDAGSCAAFAGIVESYITNWANGGSATSGGEANNQIVLTPPGIRDPGTSRSFPPEATTLGTNSTSFANTIWPIVNTNCSGCHQESAAIPQSPFFAEDDVDAAYEALVTSQKINLDDPEVSRLVVRLNPEFHNCWATPTASDPTGCITSAQIMLDAINLFRAGIDLNAVDSRLAISKALDLTDGILASGGARDDSSTIALYEMKTGSGNTLYDTSGVEPALNLNLIGTNDVDFRWVGGWGIEFMSGRAQGSAQNAKLRDQLAATGEYSIEAWIVPANVNQGTAGDPSRIISYSGSESSRNFTLGQAEYRYEYMNRTGNTDANGQPSLITDPDDEDLQASQQHVVATYDSVNGRKIYVNGVDVSTVGMDAGSTDDPSTLGDLLDWDDSFAFILGGEAGGSKQWQGKLRLVAIHNRAMTPTQVLQNFDAGVGEKFFLMFSVSDLMGDPDCFLPSAVTPSNPNGDQCFIYMLVSQYDSYSYLFSAPTFISLNPAFTPSDTVIKGMRIGVNGKEPVVGQAFANIGKTSPLTINNTDYDPLNGGQVLSNIGTIIALEKGAGADEFFLSFEQFGANNDSNVHADAEYVCDVSNMASCLTTPSDGTPVSDIGLRVFSEINATMAAITGVDPNTTAVKSTYDTLEQQLPAVETIDGFVSANQMAIAQLAIQYCSALVEDGTLRDTFFGTTPAFGFTSSVDAAFDIGGPNETARKNQIADALYDHIAAHRTSGSTVELADMPTRDQVRAELVSAAATASYPGNLFDRLYATAGCPTGCDQTRTRAVVKAMCTSVLGSASMLLQ